MQFIDRNPLYRLIRITGPHHNLLGLQIAAGSTERDPAIEDLARGSGRPLRLDGLEVATQVMLGAEDACRELSKKYYFDKIQFVSDDTPPLDVYRWLAGELIRRIDAARL